MPRFDRVVLASRNRGKEAEIRSLLADLPVRVLGPEEAGWADDVIEDGATLEENALKKARAAFGATGTPSLADDTGLFVDVLGGEPGVRSARYAGDAQDPVANCAKLLRALEGVEAGDRGAEFRAVLALVGEGVERLFQGSCPGRITLAPRGNKGFGYDPVFELPQAGRTFAEMTAEEKNNVSHRGRALALFRQFLETTLRGEMA